MSTETARTHRWSTLVTLLLIGFVPAFSGALINPTIPAIQSTFSHLPNSETLAQLVSTTSAWVVIVAAPIVGYLLDRRDRKPVLIAALVIYGVGTSVAFVLDSLYLILVTRIFDGIAVATLMVTVPTLIADYYSGGRRESVMGWYSAIQAGGGAIAAVLGGVIAGSFGWRYIFPVFALALLLIPPILRNLPEPDTTEAVRGDAGRIEAAVSIVRESPALLLAGIYLLVTFGMLTSNLIQIEVPYYLRNALGVDSSLTGVILAGVMLVTVATAGMYGRIKKHFRHATILGVGFGVAAVGFALFSVATTLPIVLVGILVAASGMGFLLPTVNDWVAAVTDPEYRGRALSGVTTMMYLGFAVSPFVPTPFIDAFGREGMFLVWAGFLVVTVVGIGTLWVATRDTTTSTDPVPSD